MELLVPFIGTGLIVGLLAVLIRYGGYYELIAGHDPDRIEDPEASVTSLGRLCWLLRA